MESFKLPIWSAYLIAPFLILACAFRVLMRSDSPVLIGTFAIVSGVACAAALHGYIAVKGIIKRATSKTVPKMKNEVRH